jgi:predicted metal-dependent phosphotriesterase family hydrolase
MTTGEITAVAGNIRTNQLGVTLAHEHLWCDISIHSGNPDNRIRDVSLVIEELEFFTRCGGRSIIEVTPEGVGRDPVALRTISEASSVQIISGVAFYQSEVYPAWVRKASLAEITDYFIRQIEEGTEGVRAGLIGELTSHNELKPDATAYRLRTDEALVFRAAAEAQRATGVAISTHASLGRGGHAQLDVLAEAGADLRRVAIGHCDAHWHDDPEPDLAYCLHILNRGAYCAFDLIGWNELVPDEIRAKRIASLIALGYERRILLSTDTCRLSQLHRFSGRGFDYLFTSFLPRLREIGVTEEQIEAMLVEAPQSFLLGS